MAFSKDLKEFVAAFQAGWKMVDDAQNDKTRSDYMKYLMARKAKEDAAGDTGDADRKKIDDYAAGSGGGGASGDDLPIADTSMEPEQKALLHSIYGDEAPAYNVAYGGKTFDSYADHPRYNTPISSGPNQGSTSSAAGRPQFLADTWDAQARKLGLKDFSPPNQDKAAWGLAADTYREKTGGDLLADLKSGGSAAAVRAAGFLKGQWTSLPGGIEQGKNSGTFGQRYINHLNRYQQKPAVAAGPKPAVDAGTPVSGSDSKDDEEGYAGSDNLTSDMGGGGALDLSPSEGFDTNMDPIFAAQSGGYIDVDRPRVRIIPDDDQDYVPEPDTYPDEASAVGPDELPASRATRYARPARGRDPEELSQAPVPYSTVGREQNPGRGEDDRYLAAPDRAAPVGAIDIVGSNPGRGRDDRYLAAPDYPDRAPFIIGTPPADRPDEGRRYPEASPKGEPKSEPRPKNAITMKKPPARAARPAVGGDEETGLTGGALPVRPDPNVRNYVSDAEAKANNLTDAQRNELNEARRASARMSQERGEAETANMAQGTGPRPWKPDTSVDPVGAAVGSGLKFLQKAFGFDSAQPAVGTDPTRQRNLAAYAANAGSDPEATAVVEKTVDPEGKLHPAQRSAAAVTAAHQFGEKSGNPEKGAELVGTVLQTYRERTMQAGAAAEQALAQGDTVAAIRALKDGYDHIPNGNTITINEKQGPNGEAVGYQYAMLAPNGKVISQGEVTPDLLKKMADLAKSGQAFDQSMIQTASKAATPAPAGAVDPAARPDAAGPRQQAPAVQVASAQPSAVSPPAGPAAGATSSDASDPMPVPPKVRPYEQVEPRPRMAPGVEASKENVAYFNSRHLKPWEDRAKAYYQQYATDKAEYAKQFGAWQQRQHDKRMEASRSASSERIEKGKIASEERRNLKLTPPDQAEVKSLNEDVDAAFKATLPQVVDPTSKKPLFGDLESAKKALGGSYIKVRQLAAEIAHYGGVSPEIAADHALTMVSPSVRYKVVGKDAAGNELIEMPDKSQMRLPAGTANRLEGLRAEVEPKLKKLREEASKSTWGDSVGRAADTVWDATKGAAKSGAESYRGAVEASPAQRATGGAPTVGKPAPIVPGGTRRDALQRLWNNSQP